MLNAFYPYVSAWEARYFSAEPVAYLVDLALSFKSIEARLVLFLLLALFYALAPIPVIYRTVAGRRGNGMNRASRD